MGWCSVRFMRDHLPLGVRIAYMTRLFTILEVLVSQVGAPDSRALADSPSVMKRRQVVHEDRPGSRPGFVQAMSAELSVFGATLRTSNVGQQRPGGPHDHDPRPDHRAGVCGG